MTRLRVLSGRHAGVSIDWISARLVVGASEDLDVFIGDWNAQQIELRHDAEGQPQARWLADAANVGVEGEQRVGDELVCALAPWVPVRFGAVILCIGPADDEWPDDADLLRRCFAPPPSSAALGPTAGHKRARPRVGRRVMITAAACCALAATSLAMQRGPVAPSAPASVAKVTSPTPSAASPGASESAAASHADPVLRLRVAITAPVLSGLEIAHSGGRVILRGVLGSRSAVDRLNRELDALPSDLPVSRRFVAAQDIVDRLYESLSGSGLTVRHVEHHRFEVTGRVAHPVQVGAAIEQVAADLADFGAQVDSTLQPLHDALPLMSGLLIDSQGTSFLRTRDGVKHIVVGAAPTAPAPLTRSTPPAPTAQETHHETR